MSDKGFQFRDYNGPMRRVDALMRGETEVFEQMIPMSMRCSFCHGIPSSAVFTKTGPTEFEVALFCDSCVIVTAHELEEGESLPIVENPITMPAYRKKAAEHTC